MAETYCEVTQKIQYGSRRQADRARREFGRRQGARGKSFKREGGATLEAFQCKHCDKWHIGRHMTNTNRRHAK